MASHNYVCWQIKALLDHCCGIIHCLGFEGKYGVSVVTPGGGEEPSLAEYMSHFMITTEVVPVSAVWATKGTITGKGFPAAIQPEFREFRNSVAGIRIPGIRGIRRW